MLDGFLLLGLAAAWCSLENFSEVARGMMSCLSDVEGRESSFAMSGCGADFGRFLP